MPEAIQPYIEMCSDFLTANWSMIVCVALGILLYKVFKQGIALVCFIVTCGVAVTLLSNLGVIPPMGDILTEMTAWFHPAG